MNPLVIVRNLGNDLREGGPRGLLDSVSSTLKNRYWERRLGVDTELRAGTWSQAGEDSVPYVPLPYGTLMTGLSRLPITPTSHLLDFGCGAGRALLAACVSGVPRVSGIEIESDLVDVARRNLAAAKNARGCNISITLGDAREFEIGADVDLIYMYKPFSGETLRLVTDRIADSLQKSPRALTVIFFNDEEFRILVADASWLRLTQSGVASPRSRWPITWGLYHSCH